MDSDSLRRKYCICLMITLAGLGLAHAGSGTIDAAAFGGDRTIVLAETFECEAGIYGLVVKREDWVDGFPGEGSVLLDTKIIRDYWDLRGAPRHESELYRKLHHDQKFMDLKEDSEKFKALLKEARTKDVEHKEGVMEALAKELKRAGLAFDPETEVVIYFFSGKAKMRVIESLQGNLKKGDEIDVTWKHIQRRVSCPHVIPFLGPCGWIFDSTLKPGAKTDLGHGFYSLKEGRSAKAAFERTKELEIAQ